MFSSTSVNFFCSFCLFQIFNKFNLYYNTLLNLQKYFRDSMIQATTNVPTRIAKMKIMKWGSACKAWILNQGTPEMSLAERDFSQESLLKFFPLEMVKIGDGGPYLKIQQLKAPTAVLTTLFHFII
jgi:hypothetical protein